MRPVPIRLAAARAINAMMVSLSLSAAAGHVHAAPAASPGNLEIKLDQIGYLPGSAKVAVVPNVDGAAFTVVKAGSDTEVMRGTLGAAAAYAPAAETVRLADFSALATPGRYQLRVAGVPDSAPFTVGADVY